MDSQALISWLIVGYIVFTERTHALKHLYNIIALLVLDGIMVILWLATWSAVAAKRAKFIYCKQGVVVVYGLMYECIVVCMYKCVI